MGSVPFKYCSKTYVFSLGVLTLQAHIRHDPPQMASVAEDQPMYKPSPISYLRRSHMWAHGKRQRRMAPLICADLLCPRIKLVKELLRDVGCIPRHGYHGADACNTRQLSVPWPRQGLASDSIFHEMAKNKLFLTLHLILWPTEDFTLSAHLFARISFWTSWACAHRLECNTRSTSFGA